MVVVNQGTSNDNKIFLYTTNSDVTGSSDITCSQNDLKTNTGTVAQ